MYVMQSSIQQLNEPIQYTQQSIKYTHTTNMGRTHTSSVVNPCSYGESHDPLVNQQQSQPVYMYICTQSCWPYSLSLSLPLGKGGCESLASETNIHVHCTCTCIHMCRRLSSKAIIQVCFTTQGLCQCTHNLHICIQSPNFPSVQYNEFGTCTLMCVHVYTIQSSHLYVYM